jgi:hypothetical protein
MGFEWIADPQAWITLVTLSAIEIVLGIDNLVFISIAVSKLPPERRPAARRFGLMLACGTRLLLLGSGLPGPGCSPGATGSDDFVVFEMPCDSSEREQRC